MISKHSIIFIGIFTILLLFSNTSYVNNLDAFAQNTTGSSHALTISKNIGGLKITSPGKGSVVPINSNSPLIIKGISNDNAASNCKVSIIINSIKPYQPVQPAAGKEDYSTWQYILLKNYTHLIAGSNKITAKSSCLNSPQNIYNSINVTGVNFSPEQLKNYNSPNLPPKNTVSNTSSPSLTNLNPITQQIQKIKESSPIVNTTTKNLQGVTPAVVNPTNQSSKSIAPVVADNTGQVTKQPIKHTTSSDTVKPTHHVKHVKHVKHTAKSTTKKMKHNDNGFNHNGRDHNDNGFNHNGREPRDLSTSIIDEVRHNLESAGIDFG
jgi:hypothetical protein